MYPKLRLASCFRYILKNTYETKLLAGCFTFNYCRIIL